MKNELEFVKALIKEMNEELKGGQKKLDVAPPFGKLTGADFKKLRGTKNEAAPVEQDPYGNKPKPKATKDKHPAGFPGMTEDHEGTDHEVSMANNSIDSIIWAAEELKKHLAGGERNIPAWIQDHITNAENYILQAAKNYHEYGAEEPTEEPEQDMSLGALAPAELNEMIKKVGKKYNVYSKKGKKLGSHPSKKKAQKQMAAIEISKQGK